jgi:carboxyl-terminal processing protease
VRGWLLAGLFAAASAFAQPAALSPVERGTDFDAMWRTLDAGYAYFDVNRPAWKRARDTWRARAVRARTRSEFAAALEGALGELHDDHVSISEPSAARRRRLPVDTDIWARWIDGAAVIEAVRAFGDADVAGLRPGHVVTKIEGIAVERAVRERLRGMSETALARDRALMQLLAGPRHGTFRLEVRDERRALEIERKPRAPASGPPIVARRMGDDRDVGYIHLRNAAGDAHFTRHFDAALDALAGTRALILDLRETTGPVTREVTRALLGRFVATETAWQLRAPPGGPRVADKVTPRAPAYRAPLVVLVDRWTAGEAEALAMGLHAAAKAPLLGTPMAGLHGDLHEVRLAHSGIVVRYPGERTFLPDGTPREALRPQIAVDLAAPSGGAADPILYQALKALERR